MKVLSVEIEDFLSIGTARFELDDKGLCLVQGENVDNPSAVSNGAGKSSLVDGVMWALYGETARGATTSEVIRHGAKIAKVSVWLRDEDGMSYVVKRCRAKSKVELTLHSFPRGGAAVEVTLGTVALTQEKIIQILGCSAEVFRSAVYLGQEQMPDLPRMTDKKLKELIEEASGLAVIEECYGRARANLLTLEAQTDIVRAEVKNLAERVSSAHENIRLIEIDAADWDRRQHGRVEAQQKHRDECATAHEEARRKCSIAVTAGERASQRLEEIDTALSGFKAANAALAAAGKEILAAERALGVVEGDARNAVRHLKTEEAHLHHISTGHPCESCGQDLPADQLETLLQAAKDTVAAARTSALEAARSVKACRERAEQARAQSAEIERTIPDVTAFQAEADTLRPLVLRAAEAERTVMERERLLVVATKVLTELKAEVNPHTKGIERACSTAEDVEKQHKVRSEALADLTRQAGEAKTVVEVFGPSGVRAEILDQVTPYLNARTAAYLDALSDGTLKALWTTIVRDAKGNPREKFSIEVTHPAGEGFVVLSGGEKRKVRLATALALQDLVASRATKPMHLFVADEIDDALDEAGLERLMGVLSEKAREKGTVLVISHNSLTDWIPTAWVVRKERGVATLETA